jgi:hypothetical protein
LLTCARPLLSARREVEAQEQGLKISWEDICSPDALATRARIASVISIASPHFGTCLAGAQGAGSLQPRRMLRDPRGALAAAQVLPKLVASVLSKVERDDLWRGLSREGRKVARFAAEFGRFQSLFQQLTPEAMDQLRARSEPAPHVRRASVVTLTGPLTESSDPFFADVSRRAAGGSTMRYGTHDPLLFLAREAIKTALSDPARSIRSARAPLSRVEITTNDGVVNSCRQMMDPRDPQELLAVVAGDHFDVIGYYDRSQGQGKHERELLSGFLRSGCHFRDDEFFALYRKIGDRIADGIEELQPKAGFEQPSMDGAVPVAAANKPKSKRARSPRPRDLER